MAPLDARANRERTRAEVRASTGASVGGASTADGASVAEGTGVAGGTGMATTARSWPALAAVAVSAVLLLVFSSSPSPSGA